LLRWAYKRGPTHELSQTEKCGPAQYQKGSEDGQVQEDDCPPEPNNADCVGKAGREDGEAGCT
jgi:hypothetical protein